MAALGRARLQSTGHTCNSAMARLRRVTRMMNTSSLHGLASSNGVYACTPAHRTHSTQLPDAHMSASGLDNKEHVHAVADNSIRVATSLATAHAQLQHMLTLHMQQLLLTQRASSQSARVPRTRHALSLIDVVDMLHRFWSAASEAILVPRELRMIEDFPLFLLSSVRSASRSSGSSDAAVGCCNSHSDHEVEEKESDKDEGYCRAPDRFTRMSDDAILHEFEQWMAMSSPRRTLAPACSSWSNTAQEQEQELWSMDDVMCYTSLIGYVASYIRYHTGVRWGASSHPFAHSTLLQQQQQQRGSAVHRGLAYMLHPWHGVYCPAGRAAQMPFVHVMQWMMDRGEATDSSSTSSSDIRSRRLQRHHCTELFAPPSLLCHRDGQLWQHTARPGFAVLDLGCQSGFGVDLLLKAGATRITAVDSTSASLGNTEATVREHLRERRSKRSGQEPASVVMYREEELPILGSRAAHWESKNNTVSKISSTSRAFISFYPQEQREDVHDTGAHSSHTAVIQNDCSLRAAPSATFHEAALRRRRQQQQLSQRHNALLHSEPSSSHPGMSAQPHRSHGTSRIVLQDDSDDVLDTSTLDRDMQIESALLMSSSTRHQRHAHAQRDRARVRYHLSNSDSNDGVYDVIYYHPTPPSLLPMQACHALTPNRTESGRKQQRRRCACLHARLPASCPDDMMSHLHHTVRLLHQESYGCAASPGTPNKALHSTDPSSDFSAVCGGQRSRALLREGGYVVWILPRTHDVRALLLAAAQARATSTTRAPSSALSTYDSSVTTLSDWVIAQLEDVYKVVLRRRHPVAEAAAWDARASNTSKTSTAMRSSPDRRGKRAGDELTEVPLMHSLIDMLCTLQAREDGTATSLVYDQQHQQQQLRERLHSQLTALYAQHMWVDVLVLKKRRNTARRPCVREGEAHTSTARCALDSEVGSSRRPTRTPPRAVKQTLHSMHDARASESRQSCFSVSASDSHGPAAEPAVNSDESTVNGVAWLDSFDYNEYKPQSQPSTREHWTDLVPSYSYLEPDYWSPQEAERARSCFLAVGHTPLLQSPRPHEHEQQQQQQQQQQNTARSDASSLREEQQRAAAAAYRSVFTNELRTRRRSKMRKLALDGLEKQEWFIDNKLVQSEAAKVEFMNQLTRWDLKDKE